jgi:hypothetical protein
MDDIPDITTYLLTIFPDDIWHGFFSLEALKRFTPRRGVEGFVPMLELFYLDDEDARNITTVLLRGPGGETQEGRYEIMADVAASCATKAWRVFAVVLATEAWRATVPITTPRSQLRPAKSYANRVEILHVAGKTMDGRISMACAPIYRGAAQTIMGLGTWDVMHASEGDRLEANLLDHFWDAYSAAMVKAHIKPDLN